MQQVALELVTCGARSFLAIKVNETDGNSLSIELEAQTTEAIASLKEVHKISLSSEEIQVGEEERRARTRTIAVG